MKNALLAIFVVPLLTMPAFAGALNAGDKPTVVAENVGVQSELASVSDIVIGTMVTSICPLEDTAITVTIAAKNKSTGRRAPRAPAL
jgi:hypothetical protein